MNIPLHKIKAGLLNTPVIKGRMQLIKLKNNIILINDTYNANVASMIHAIKTLEKMPGYKILVVGDMSELGKQSIVYHQIIGNIANISKINEVFSVGKMSKEISQIFHNSKHFLNIKTLNKHLKKILVQKKNITILVKGSRKARMEHIVHFLTKPSN